MIRRERDGLVCSCDECGHETSGVIVGVTDADEFVRELKGHGWTVRPDEDGGWTHRCSEACND